MVKEGKEYIKCPLCGFNRVYLSMKRVDKGKPEELQWMMSDPATDYILQIRVGGGKKAGTGAKGRGKAPGSGFHMIDGATLNQMIQEGNYPELLTQMQEQLIRLINYAVTIGFINKEEIK